METFSLFLYLLICEYILLKNKNKKFKTKYVTTTIFVAWKVEKLNQPYYY